MRVLAVYAGGTRSVPRPRSHTTCRRRLRLAPVLFLSNILVCKVRIRRGLRWGIPLELLGRAPVSVEVDLGR